MVENDDDLEDCWIDCRPGKPLPDKVTIGSKYERAMQIENETEARREFDRLVRHSMRVGNLSREEAERVERANLGYYAGYYNVEVQARVERLFRAEHPIFGSTSSPVQLTAEEAFRTGMNMAQRIRRRTSPVYCEHANEMPAQCPCDSDCYCKDHSCRSG